MTSRRESTYAMVSRIPSGQVASYGQIARLLSQPRGARQVGYALAALSPDSQVPWHRVVNAQGRISPRGLNGAHDLQRLLLEDEGVAFDAQGRIDLSSFGWAGPATGPEG